MENARLDAVMLNGEKRGMAVVWFAKGLVLLQFIRGRGDVEREVAFV